MYTMKYYSTVKNEQTMDSCNILGEFQRIVLSEKVNPNDYALYESIHVTVLK